MVARVVAGVLAGALTYGSFHMWHDRKTWVVACVCGLIVGYVSAAAAARRLILAGVTANFIATAVFIGTAVVGLKVQYGIRLGFDELPDLLRTSGVFLAWFVLPGLLTSVWVWEGRKPFPPADKSE
jgi:hypothetical protein